MYTYTLYTEVLCAKDHVVVFKKKKNPNVSIIIVRVYIYVYMVYINAHRSDKYSLVSTTPAQHLLPHPKLSLGRTRSAVLRRGTPYTCMYTIT